MKPWSWCSIVLVISCGGTSLPPSSANVPRSAANGSVTSSPEQTSGVDACTRDDECFCRVFDGASFQPGRERSTCCAQAAGCSDAVGASIPAGHCLTCVYD